MHLTQIKPLLFLNGNSEVQSIQEEGQRSRLIVDPYL